MIIYEDTMEKFIDFANNKTVVCFGIGKVFDELSNIITELSLNSNILILVDNDENKVNKIKIINGTKYTIQQLIDIEDEIDSETIFFITSVYYKAIINQLNTFGKFKNNIGFISSFNIQQSSKTEYLYPVGWENMLDRENDFDIGINGANLTISILMCNRVELTLRLLESINSKIPQFQGEVLIGDNGSDKRQLVILKRELKNFGFDYSLIEFGKNLGTSKGRNLLHQSAKKTWIMQLDNDIYFSKNILTKLRTDIQMLKCSFWGLPYYDQNIQSVIMYGCNLYFEKEKSEVYLNLRDSKYFDNEKMKKEWCPILCTYMPGGAGVFKKNDILKEGGYDENIYIAHEDIELALRLYQSGYKIGNAGIVGLIHDHKKSNEKSDIEYEKVRFSPQIMIDDKEYFYKKHGIRVK